LNDLGRYYLIAGGHTTACLCGMGIIVNWDTTMLISANYSCCINLKLETARYAVWTPPRGVPTIENDTFYPIYSGNCAVLV
jgi:hypothetical protein